jgi:putative adenylate-forming enzyme
VKRLILRYWLGLRLRPTWRNRAALEAWQRRQLRQLARFLRRRSPYYQALMAQGYDLDSFPLVNKTSFMAHFNQINTVGLDREEAMALALRSEQTHEVATLHGYAVGLSTGTSGNRGLFVVSEAERAQWVAMVLHRVLKPRLRRQRIAFILRANNQLYESVQSRLFEFRYYQLPESMADFVAELNAYQPEVLTGQPSVLRMLAEAQLAGQLTLALTQVISYAEVLEPDDRARIELAFGQRLDEVYQCTEGFLGATCAHGTLHLNEDVLRIEREYLDERRFHPIVTDLRRRTQPVIRYRLNDILVEAEQPCPCGSARLALARIEGRMDDVLRLPNQAGELLPMFPDWIRRCIVMSQDGVQEYLVKQTTADHIEVYLDCEAAEFAGLKRQVLTALEHLFADKQVRPPTLSCHHSVPPSSAIKRRRIVCAL